MRRTLLTLTLALATLVGVAQSPAEYVNPFIGTTNFGTTNPGALVPNGLMSVTPFNVMGSSENVYDKDARWWSTPYEYHNKFFTGFSHVNLSGVGCPDMGSLLLMATTGDINVNYKEYGSEYSNEAAHPGYYTNTLTKYGIKNEVTATERTGISRFTFPAGQANILLNLGEGLTNETGARVRKVSDTEIEGSKLLGTFCYAAQAVYPIYFVMRVNKKPINSGFWKMQRPMSGVEAEWDSFNGKYKIYTKYEKEMFGDDIGYFYSFDTKADEQIEVELAVSFVSTENARQNLEAETRGQNFEAISKSSFNKWNEALSKIMVEGGTAEQREVFYTAMYHLLIHPNILQDVNGDYPAMESNKILNTDGNRYTVYSLWDTYRNVHQLISLLYPKTQLDMVNTMIDMYKESGWLPKWELFGRETLTMEGDPAIPVITDTYLRGLRDFDLETAYEAMKKGATTPGPENLLRPDNDDYLGLGYVPLRGKYDNSVSHALEYYLADYSLSVFARELGYEEEAETFYNRSLGYKNYYCPEYGLFRPKLPNGEFLTPFDPKQGENFEPSPGFHEGNSYNYSFYVPHDVLGLAKLMGGKKNFVDKLQMIFDKGYYDPANEPDIAYPYLFSYFKGEEWRTQKEVKRLLDKYYTTKPDGIPGNDDTGTMSAWAIFSMMGFYPDCAGSDLYTLTTPTFDKVTITLDPEYYGADKLVITKSGEKDAPYIKSIELGGKSYKKYQISHGDLVKGGELKFNVKK